MRVKQYFSAKTYWEYNDGRVKGTVNVILSDLKLKKESSSMPDSQR